MTQRAKSSLAYDDRTPHSGLSRPTRRQFFRRASPRNFVFEFLSSHYRQVLEPNSVIRPARMKSNNLPVAARPACERPGPH